MRNQQRTLSKTQKILMHLLKGRTINQIQASKMFGAWRLSGLIFVLRKRGFGIDMNVNAKGRYKGIGTYTLKSTPKVVKRNATRK